MRASMMENFMNLIWMFEEKWNFIMIYKPSALREAKVLQDCMAEVS